MEKLFLSSSSTTPQAALTRPFLSPLSITRQGKRTLSLPLTKPRKFPVLASKDENDFRNKLTAEDLMELKFGRLLGEDPKLTLAKVMGKKLDPDASYLEIEKNFYRNKGKIIEVKEVPFDAFQKRGSANSKDKLNLVKPVAKEGIKVGGRGESSLVDINKPRKPSGDAVINSVKSDVPNVILRKPSGDAVISSVKSNVSNVILRKPSGDAVVSSVKPSGDVVASSVKSNVPNVILRKPSVYNEADDDEMAAAFRMKVKPNLSLKMRTEKLKEKFGSMTLLKRPELVSTSKDIEESSSPEENISANNYMHAADSAELEAGGSEKIDQLLDSQQEPTSKLNIADKPKPIVNKNIEENAAETPSIEIAFAVEKDPQVKDKISGYYGHEGDTERGVQLLKPNDSNSPVNEKETSNLLTKELVGSSLSAEAAIRGRPQRLDQPVKATTYLDDKDTTAKPEGFMEYAEKMNSSQTSELKEHENSDWHRAEKLCKAGHRAEVELISCSTRGFAVSFGSLIGFIPYRNLTARWKYFAFPSWLRRKGLDPSKYRQSLGIARRFEFPDNDNPLVSSPHLDNSQLTENQVTPDMGLEDLLRIYDQEKTKFLSSFVGQLVKVNFVIADKKSRKLIFSVKPKENEEMVEKKRNLMARLSVGDVVKCCIKKITYFGIFVEVEGIPALINQREVSWDASLDPASYFKLGQYVDAKVYELDYSLERIFLSLKEITPDAMIEALECVVGDNDCLTGRFESAQIDYEWADVDSLIDELERIDGVQAVSKGRFFLSPGLAPTFQVYMASVFDNQYKLLARSGNKAQEVMVEASLGAEEMRTAIMTCTNRVA